MSEIATPNLKTFFQGAVTAAQFPNADLVGGLNKGGSCSPGVGVNTGDYDPKVTDWSRDVRNPQNGQNIGGVAAPLTVDQGADINDQVAFVEATGAVAPDADIIAGVANKTGKTLESGNWAWGLKAIA